MTVFQLFSDKKKEIALYGIIVFFIYLLFFCLTNRIINKYIVRYSFFKQNSIEILVKASDYCCDVDYLYIYASPGVDVLPSLPNCNILMQSASGINIERHLDDNEIVVTSGISEELHLEVGDTIKIKKLYESDYNVYVIKDIIHDSYLKMSDVNFEFNYLIFLPFDANYEQFLETQYVILSTKDFSELPNDIKIKSSYLLTRKEINKELYFFCIILFFVVLGLYLIISEISINLFHEKLFKRIYNLFNLGQGKKENVGIILSLLVLIQFFPMQMAIVISYFINIDTYLSLISFLITSGFNILIFFNIIFVVYSKDMKQGRTVLL